MSALRASGITMYTKPRSGSGPRASTYGVPSGMSGRMSYAVSSARRRRAVLSQGAWSRGLHDFADRLEVVLGDEPVAAHVHPAAGGVDAAQQEPLRELGDERAGGRTAQVLLGRAGDGEVVAVPVGRADRAREAP